MSSREDDISRLRHMLDAAQQILKFTQDCSQKGLDDNEMLSLAVVRLIEIIGEAAINVSNEVQLASPEIPWRQIKGTRNRLAHAYFDVDMDVIWGIVSKGLKPLVQNLSELLTQLENS